jgi:DNA-binding transcriptional ArsR family regulator
MNTAMTVPGPGGSAQARSAQARSAQAQSAPVQSALAGDVDQVFAALADPTRRQLLELLGGQAAASATALAGQLPVSRQAVVKHLAVLQQSDLVTRRRDGREVVFTVRPERLAATASWMTSVAASWQERLQLLKHAAEAAGRPAEAGDYRPRPGDRPDPA